MKKSITYAGNGQVAIELQDGRMMRVTKGGTIKRGDIPDDAFKALAARPDFGGDFEAYRRARAEKWGRLSFEQEVDLAHAQVTEEKAAAVDAPEEGQE